MKRKLQGRGRAVLLSFCTLLATGAPALSVGSTNLTYMHRSFELKTKFYSEEYLDFAHALNVRIAPFIKSPTD